ncbi:MAG: NAD(P)H-dependent oxidoreductase [Saccharofermentanales bacterium]|jgi:FMN-dependent NADH-azoreductase|nr:NAD(P)H-dependent oxidoreductase [Eubacteriales bacterium]MDD3610856.1 NAD(P)H-dependent oxidoreductase [Eubacteriales bacterium]
MEKLLFIDSCIRREESRTKKAADYLMQKLEATGKYEIESLCLMDEPLVYLSGDFFKQRERLLAEGKRNHRRFDYAHQFAQADVIVVAAPFWDLGFPALLKTYIENVSVDGITFYADAEGCHGMSRGRHLIFVTTRGGDYEDTPLEMGSRYMEALGVFFGIDDYSCLFAEGLDGEGNDPEALMQELFAEIDRFVAEL